jgi:hypothetical protein
MVENRNANIVRDCWLGLPGHYPYVSLDAFVVMPNHVHGIIVLVDADGAGGVQTDAARAGCEGTGCEWAGLKPAPNTKPAPYTPNRPSVLRTKPRYPPPKKYT